MMKKIADISIGALKTPGFEVTGIGDATYYLIKIISTVVGFLTAIAFIYFTIQLFIGALAWITAGGDKGKLEQAKAKISSAIQGVVIVIAAIFIIELVGLIFDINFLDIELMLGRLLAL